MGHLVSAGGVCTSIHFLIHRLEPVLSVAVIVPFGPLKKSLEGSDGALVWRVGVK